MKLGRPIMLDQTIQEQICHALKMGATNHEACLAANIGESTFYQWMEIGKAIASDQPHERIPAHEADQQAMLDFYNAVRRARRTTAGLANRVLRTAMRPHSQIIPARKLSPPPAPAKMARRSPIISKKSPGP